MSSGWEKAKRVKAYREEHPELTMREAKAIVDGFLPDPYAASVLPATNDGGGVAPITSLAVTRSHRLGFGLGTILERPNGTASYRKPGTLSDAFRVRIADITGFAVSKGGKPFERELRILGQGTELAKCDVNHGVAEKIEAWFRAHPSFGRAATPPATPPATGQATPVSVADELTNLAALRDRGILTNSEFVVAKARLLSRPSS